MNEPSGSATLPARAEQTAPAVGSSDVPALATPWLVAIIPARISRRPLIQRLG